MGKHTLTSAHGITLAPWTLDETWMTINGANGAEVCAIHAGVPDGAPTRAPRNIAHANAALIAAAPELLDALKAAYDLMPIDGTTLRAQWHDLARAALRQAGGA